MAGSPPAEACPVREPPALGWAWGQTGKGKACRTPVGWALSPPPVLEFGVQPGPLLPWGRPVSPDGPSRQKRPSPDPSARRHPPTKGPGGLALERVSPRRAHSVGTFCLGGQLPGRCQRDAGPTWPRGPGLPGGHPGFRGPCCPARAPGVRGRGRAAWPLCAMVGVWCAAESCVLTSVCTRVRVLTSVRARVLRSVCVHACAQKCVCARVCSEVCVCTGESPSARRGDPLCAADPVCCCVCRWLYVSVVVALVVVSVRLCSPGCSPPRLLPRPGGQRG